MFPQAPHPDTVLAYVKDNYYVEQVKEHIQETVRDIIGGRRTEILKPELELFARGLYYLLSIGIGSQTLGQEYCDLRLVGLVESDEAALPLGRAQRFLHTILEVALPYLWRRGVEGPGWAHAARHLRPEEAGAAAGPTRGGAAGGGPGWRRRRRPPSPSSSGRPGGETGAGAGARAAAAAGAAAAAAAGAGARAAAVAGALVRAARARRGALLWAARVHLAAYFLTGRHYTWALRLARAGLRRTAAGAPARPRASYRALGALLAAQAVIEAGLAVRGVLVAAVGGDGGGGGDDDGTQEAAARRRQEELQIKVPSQLSERQRRTSSADYYAGGTPAGPGPLLPLPPRAGGGPRCALCQGGCHLPAAPPCGHLFCWACAAALLAVTPECPVCRQPALPQSLIVLRHYAAGGDD